MNNIMEEISPLPDLHCLHRGTRKDLENRRDHYRLCSDPSDTEEVGVHVHHGCFNIGDAKTVAEEIQRRCNSYPSLIATVDQQAATIAELVEALENMVAIAGSASQEVHSLTSHIVGSDSQYKNRRGAILVAREALKVERDSAQIKVLNDLSELEQEIDKR